MTHKRGCAFTGHRDIYDALSKGLENRLLDVIEELAGEGIEVFYTGGAVGFDTAAAKAVLRLRPRLGIGLCVCVPFAGQDKHFDPDERQIYRAILDAADDVITVSEGYSKNAFYARNRFMVDMCEVCVAYLTEETGGTAYTVRYARRRGKRVINLADELSGLGTE